MERNPVNLIVSQKRGANVEIDTARASLTQIPFQLHSYTDIHPNKDITRRVNLFQPIELRLRIILD